MRRKFPGKNVEPKPPTPGAPEVPARPTKQLAEAQGELQELLLGKDAHVATGYGFGDDPKKRDSAWRLYVFTMLDAQQLPLPAEVRGFPVARRHIPAARPAFQKR